MRKPASLALLLLLLALPGCIFSPKPDPGPGTGTRELTPNDTPENTIKRFMEVYAQKRPNEYELLFTGDFLFEFSNAADPNLVQEYSTGWTKDDEKVSSTNLFQGGVNNDGVYQPGALNIEVELLPKVPADDNGAGRDPNLYKVLLASVSVRIDVPGDLTYVIGEAPPQSNRFFLVRGDQAIGLTAQQPADANHWYIWNWRDESPSLKASPPGGDLGPQQAVPGPGVEHLTWGALKDKLR